jgi:chromosome segregation protein
MIYKVDKIKRSIESIGPINWAVKDEYEEKSSRLNVLLEQKADLVEAESNLKEAIKKIDKVAQEQFFETFSKVKENFEKCLLFSLMVEMVALNYLTQMTL